LAVLLLASKQNSHANRILGLWCLCLALNFLGPFIPLDGPPNGFSFLIGWHFFYLLFMVHFCICTVAMPLTSDHSNPVTYYIFRLG
jgi:hypothetical protein